MKAKDLKKFLVFWISNILLIYLATLLMPKGYALGNMNFEPITAAVASGLALTMVGLFAKVFARGAGITKRGRYPMFLYYGLANTAGIWLIARVADLTGFGIARYYYAIILGFVVSLTHWAIRQMTKTKN